VRVSRNGLATTLLTLEEVDVLARGLARLVVPDSNAEDAHDASRLIYLNGARFTGPKAELMRIYSMATHLAELRNDLAREEVPDADDP
jgi:hypothetical protein